MMLRRPDGRRSRLGAVAMHANLHKRTHQVLENKGFSFFWHVENEAILILGEDLEGIKSSETKMQKQTHSQLRRTNGVTS
jgi:hypothetical protein